MESYWQRQTAEHPLFPELLWSRPENKRAAGKLLIIGGNAHGFVAPAEAFRVAEAVGAGAIHMVLPDSLKPYVGPAFTAGGLAPTTPSGSFSRKALAEFLDHAAWADGVLLAGELGRNSETAIVLEQFAAKYVGRLTVTRDALDYFKATPKSLLNRPETTVVLSIGQLQKLCMACHFPLAITLGMDLLKLVETLHQFSLTYPANIVVKHAQNIVVASQSQISSTKLPADMSIWRVKTAATCTVWWLQNPSKPFQSLTTAIYSTI